MIQKQKGGSSYFWSWKIDVVEGKEESETFGEGTR